MERNGQILVVRQPHQNCPSTKLCFLKSIPSWKKRRERLCTWTQHGSLALAPMGRELRAALGSSTLPAFSGCSGGTVLSVSAVRLNKALPCPQHLEQAMLDRVT